MKLSRENREVHRRTFNFVRYTKLGCHRSFRQFYQLSSGMTSGRGTALAWSLRYFLLSFVSFRR